jgi:hypothetical protein
VQISIKDNLKKVKREVGVLFRDQIPFVASQAINDTAFDTRAGLKETLKKDIDKPTPYTVRGVLVGRKRATKRNLRRTVDMDQARYEYMQHQLFGGTRRPRRKLIAIGRGVKRNKYGNVGRGTLKRLEGRADTYWGREGKAGTFGLWQREQGHRLKLLVGTIGEATYTKRVDWFKDAQHTVRTHYQSNFARRFNAVVKKI